MADTRSDSQNLFFVLKMTFGFSFLGALAGIGRWLHQANSQWTEAHPLYQNLPPPHKLMTLAQALLVESNIPQVQAAAAWGAASGFAIVITALSLRAWIKGRRPAAAGRAAGGDGLSGPRF